MRRITSTDDLLAILAEEAPVAYVDRALARAPRVRCYLGPCTLGDVCRWQLAPAALRWVDGELRHDPAAAARVRLQAVIWRDERGAPLFAGDLAGLLATLPAGVVDRLLYASDLATGYRPAAPDEAADGDSPTVYASGEHTLVEGLFPAAPEAAVCVAAYDFAALARSEEAALVTFPGGQVRLEVLAWPALIAASLRGPEPGAPALLTAADARRLPYGAARTIVETADRLSEMGGPDPAVRFLDPRRPGLDRAESVAPATDGPLSR